MEGSLQSGSCEMTRVHMVEEPNMGIDKKAAGYRKGAAVGLKIFHMHKLSR